MSCDRYRIEFTKQAQKDIAKLTPKLKTKLIAILRNKIAIAPQTGKPLVGDLTGYYSVRLSFQDRIVYRIEDDRCVILIIRAKSHYGE